MSELWALTASAGELASTARDELSREMDRWLEAGGDGVALTTRHRVDLYGIDEAPPLLGPRLRTGAAAVSQPHARRGWARAGEGLSLEAGAAQTSRAAAIAVALGGPWVELEAVAGNDLPRSRTSPRPRPSRLRCAGG